MARHVPVLISSRCVRSYVYLPQEYGCWKNYTGYCSREGLRKFEFSSDVVGRDRYDNFQQRISDENGHFAEKKKVVFQQKETNGDVYRWCEPFQALDVNLDIVWRFYLCGTYGNDKDDWGGQTDFFNNVRLCCTGSSDGGESFGEEIDLTAKFQEQHPDCGRPLISCSHLLSLSDGESIKVPTCIRVPDGKSWQCRVLTGAHLVDDMFLWHWGEAIPAPDVADAFMSEFSIAECKDGRLLAFCRCDHRGADEGKERKYFAFSANHGETWSCAQELKYDDGTTFYSPDSCGFLLRHSSGRLYYVTNILDCDHINPWYTRSTISIVEIDETIPAAIKSTQMLIDRRRPGELPEVAMSNFSCFEERETGHVIVQSPKSMRYQIINHDSELWEYRIDVER